MPGFATRTTTKPERPGRFAIVLQFFQNSWFSSLIFHHINSVVKIIGDLNLM